MDVHHALILDFHQPAGTLERLLGENQWDAKEILYALDRVPRSLWSHAELARVHLTLSGTLLETLSSPAFQERVYGIVKLGDLLWFLQNEQLFEVLGTGYYHPIFPLVPPRDWPEQTSRWLGIGRHLLWRDVLPGFWPPELGFSMELIPVLARYGYTYVVVDSEHVEPVDPMRWDEVRYRPHVAEHDGQQIIVIVRDRELSNALLAGAPSEWFEHEVGERTRHCDFPPLVTTALPGDEGGWFRNVEQNFWTNLYIPLLQRYREAEHSIRPIHVSEYLQRYGASGRVKVRPGAWNTGTFDGLGFLRWAGTPAAREALARLHEVHAGIARVEQLDHDPALLEQARWRLLRAECSSNFCPDPALQPGEPTFPDEELRHAHADLDAAEAWLEKAVRRLR